MFYSSLYLHPQKVLSKSLLNIQAIGMCVCVASEILLSSLFARRVPPSPYKFTPWTTALFIGSLTVFYKAMFTFQVVISSAYFTHADRTSLKFQGGACASCPLGSVVHDFSSLPFFVKQCTQSALSDFSLARAGFSFFVNLVAQPIKHPYLFLTHSPLFYVLISSFIVLLNFVMGLFKSCFFALSHLCRYILDFQRGLYLPLFV